MMVGHFLLVRKGRGVIRMSYWINAARKIVYHGTSTRNYDSILSEGLRGTRDRMYGKDWGHEESFGGVYLTESSKIAVESARETVYEYDENPMIVVVDVETKMLVPDEDEITTLFLSIEKGMGFVVSVEEFWESVKMLVKKWKEKVGLKGHSAKLDSLFRGYSEYLWKTESGLNKETIRGRSWRRKILTQLKKEMDWGSSFVNSYRMPGVVGFRGKNKIVGIFQLVTEGFKEVLEVLWGEIPSSLKLKFK